MKTKIVLLPVALAAVLMAGQPVRAERNPARDAMTLLTNAKPIQLPPYFVRPGLPMVTRFIEPRISTDYIGRRLELRFVVTVAGRAEDIMPVNVGSDLNLVTQLGAAISGWEFEPARDIEGNAQESVVILPVEIGPSEDATPEVPKGGAGRLPAYYVRVNHDEPAALHYIIPRIGPAFSGHSVTLRFIVDRKGRPYQIDSVGAADRNLVAQLVASVSGWEFDPARDATGHPIERVMLLPVMIE